MRVANRYPRIILVNAMRRTALTVVLLTTLTVSMAASSEGYARTATASQPGCTQEHALTTSWFQALLDDEERGSSRNILGLTHLENQPIRALGAQPGDNEICNQLFHHLHEHYRTLLTAVPPQAVVFYYAVGDRYLVHVGSDVTVALWGITISFDLDFNKLASMI